MLVRSLSNSRGAVNKLFIGFIFISLVLISYYAIMVGPMYFKHEMMTFDVNSEIKHARHNLRGNKIKNNILNKADIWGLPIYEEDISIDVSNEYIEIYIYYEVEKVFFGKWPRYYDFYIDEAGYLFSQEIE